jgi:hypothetical protein
MSFLFPLFLAAGAAVLAPLLLHLRRQPPSRVKDFSSLMFLDPTQMVTTTKRRMERWLLLLLRCLALLLLALMFARPYRSDEDVLATGGKGVAALLLLDQSASMSRGELWEQAEERLLDHVSRLNAEDRAAVAVFDQSVETLLGFHELAGLPATQRASVIKSKLSGRKPGHLSTRVDDGLMAAVALLDGTRVLDEGSAEAPKERRVVLISDLQEGAHLEKLRVYTWPDDVTVELEALSVEENPALAMTLAESSEESTELAKSVRLRISSTAQSDATNYEVKMDDGTEAVAKGQLPSGVSQIVRVPRPQDEQSHRFTLVAADDWELDNTVYLAPLQPQRPLVLMAGGKSDVTSPNSALYYLPRALQPTRQLKPEVHAPKQATDWSAAQWSVVLLEAGLDLKPVVSFLKNGGKMLVLVDRSATAEMLKELLGQETTLTEAMPKEFSLITEVDTKHPALGAFADSRLANFSALRIWHHRKLEGLPTAVKTLMRYDNGDPALLQLLVGKGELQLMTTTWAPQDSQWALVPHFIPLLYGMLEQTGGRLDQSHQRLAGDGMAKQLGFIKQNQAEYAVNLPPEESRGNPMSPTLLASLGVPLEDSVGKAQLGEAAKVKLAQEALEGRQQLWLILLALLLWIIGMETWVASRHGVARGTAS